MIVVEIKKYRDKFEKEETESKGFLKDFLQNSKSFSKKVWITIVNSERNIMQEILMGGYYYRYFKRLEKEMIKEKEEQGWSDIESMSIDNSENELIVEMSFKDEESFLHGRELDEKKYDKGLLWSLFDIRLSEAIKKNDLDKIERKKKKVEKKFLEEFQKNQPHGIRFSLEKVKKLFRASFDQSLNMPLREVCVKFNLIVKWKKK